MRSKRQAEKYLDVGTDSLPTGTYLPLASMHRRRKATWSSASADGFLRAEFGLSTNRSPTARVVPLVAISSASRACRFFHAGPRRASLHRSDICQAFCDTPLHLADTVPLFPAPTFQRTRNRSSRGRRAGPMIERSPTWTGGNAVRRRGILVSLESISSGSQPRSVGCSALFVMFEARPR